MRKTRLLSTVLLDQQLIDMAAEQGIELDMTPFIEIQPTLGEEQKTDIEELFNLPVTAVFTSANAVEAVGNIIGSNKPGWSIYCLSGATQQAVYDHFDMQAITRIN